MMKIKSNVSPPASGAPSTDALLTDTQAAEFLGVKPRTLRLWRHRRGLPHLALTAKVIRFRRADLERWLDRHAVQMRTA